MIKTLFAALVLVLPMIATAQDADQRKYLTPTNDTFILTTERCVAPNGNLFDRRYSLAIIHYSAGGTGIGCWQNPNRNPDGFNMFDFKTDAV